jgi:excinuclease UvrABC ATPase subunit
MTVDGSCFRFGNDSKIYRKVKPFRTLVWVILHLGNKALLSGGEAQLKLLENYLKRYRKYVLYLDEPATGLHFEDIGRYDGSD